MDSLLHLVRDKFLPSLTLTKVATGLVHKYATMHVLNTFLEPGELVVNPARPDWGIGQVQSIAANLITVNFENAGKVVLDGTQVVLETSTGTDTRF